MENGDQDSASRLEQARIAAGFEKSARQAALHFGWAPSTYGAHENGQNRLKREPAEKFGEHIVV